MQIGENIPNLFLTLKGPIGWVFLDHWLGSQTPENSWTITKSHFLFSSPSKLIHQFKLTRLSGQLSKSIESPLIKEVETWTRFTLQTSQSLCNDDLYDVLNVGPLASIIPNPMLKSNFLWMLIECIVKLQFNSHSNACRLSIYVTVQFNGRRFRRTR